MWEQLDRPAVRVGEPDRAVALVARDAQRVEVSARVVRRARVVELEGAVVVPGLASAEKLQ
jgi:hypothetical protein